jgi:hypothetical protein
VISFVTFVPTVLFIIAAVYALKKPQPGAAWPPYSQPAQPGAAWPLYSQPAQPGAAWPPYSQPAQPGAKTDSQKG